MYNNDDNYFDDHDCDDSNDYSFLTPIDLSSSDSRYDHDSDDVMIVMIILSLLL